jgi:ferric-dicitrate binding protein FerR (iron transport regulator)
MSPSDIAALLRRFVDDRDGLQEHEYAQLAEAVKQSPELAVQLRDQLVMDDVLSQRLAIDRRHFDAQVQQRIADHVRGEDELNQQANELRSLALARLETAPAEPAPSWSTVIAWGAALVILLTVGWGVWSWRQSQQIALLATVAEVSGEVIIQRYPNASDVHPTVGQSLHAGDVLTVADDANIALTWSDGTRVQLSGGTQISLPKTSAGKRLSVDLGDVAASVAPQPADRPMIFVTPHADAIVRGTELSLHVQQVDTRLDVLEGKVELVERETQDVQLVESSQSATARMGLRVVKNAIRWPTSQRGMVYLFSAGRPAPLLRIGSSLRPSQLSPRGPGAALNSQGEIELSGGWYEDAAAGARIAQQVRSASAMSLELAFIPAPPGDEQPRAILSFPGGQEGWFLTQANDRVQWEAANHGSVAIATLLEFDKLTHLAITYQADRLAVFLDGQSVVDVPLARWLPANKSRLVIGGVDADAHWQGRIAGLAIYDRKLERTEIERNFAGLVND